MVAKVTVEQNSASETYQKELQTATDATLVPESKPNPNPVVPIEADMGAQATGDEKVQSATAL